MGTEPDIVNCENCDAEIVAEEACISTVDGRLLCNTCHDNEEEVDK